MDELGLTKRVVETLELFLHVFELVAIVVDIGAVVVLNVKKLVHELSNDSTATAFISLVDTIPHFISCLGAHCYVL